jgi:integrase
MGAAKGSIRKLNGRYYIRTRVQVIDPATGESRWKQVEKAAGTSRKQAGEALKALQSTVDEGAYVPTQMTVLELGRKWLQEHVQPNHKPGAAANYKGTFYRHIAPSLGARRVDDFKPQMVKDLLAHKRTEGLSEETVAKIRRHMHAMFAFAQDAGLLTVNPAAAPRKRGQKERRRARGTALTPMQIKRFLNECSPRWMAFFTIALDTGLRRGELIGLRWGDVDLLERTLSVRRSIGKLRRPERSAHDQDRGRGEARADPRRRPGRVGEAVRRRCRHGG